MRQYISQIQKLSIYIIAALLLFSCSSDDNGNNPEPGNNVELNEMSLDVSGSVVGPRSGKSVITTSNGKGYNTFEIDGSDGPDATFEINFYTYNGGNDPVPWPEKGTYSLNSDADYTNGKGFRVSFEDVVEWRDYSRNVTGTLTITDNSNERLKGTFEFSADEHGGTGSISVTNGVFYASMEE